MTHGWKFGPISYERAGGVGVLRLGPLQLVLKSPPPRDCRHNWVYLGDPVDDAGQPVPIYRCAKCDDEIRVRFDGERWVTFGDDQPASRLPMP